MSNTATQQDVERIKSGASQNDQLVIAAFAARGVACTPREDVFTYGAWRAQGRQVKKGETGVKVQVYIPKRGDDDGDGEDGDGDGKKTGGRILKTVTVFHVSQTKAEGEDDRDNVPLPLPDGGEQEPGSPEEQKTKPVPMPAPAKPRNTERLAEMGLKKFAEGMEALTRERLQNTAKRARQAKYAREEAGVLIDAAMIAVYVGEAGDRVDRDTVRTFGDCMKMARYSGLKDSADMSIQAMIFRAASGHWVARGGDEQPQPDEAKKQAGIKTRIANLDKNSGVDFFPTPKNIAAKLVAMADICKGETVLEPSAGYGSIADEIVKTGARVICVEASYTLANICRDKNLETYTASFVEWAEVNGGEWEFDAIIMNPPFSADELHLKTAFDMLPEFGRVVAIIGEGAFFGRRGEKFMPWLASVGATVERLPANAFMDRTMPVTTGANARIVKIIKGSAPTELEIEPQAASLPEEADESDGEDKKYPVYESFYECEKCDSAWSDESYSPGPKPSLCEHCGWANTPKWTVNEDGTRDEY